MRLVTYEVEHKGGLGVISKDGKWVYPLRSLDMDYKTMQELIEGISESEKQLLEYVSGQDPYKIRGAAPIEEVRFLAPIKNPKQDVICLGINYMDHAEDQSHSDIVTDLDYEVELAVIIGKEAKNVPEEEVKNYIFGYTIINDVSARTLQTRHNQWYFGKSLDGFFPMGPCITTVEDIPYPPKLSIQSRVNGELRQDSNTGLLIFGIDHIVSELSKGMTLKPGTIIATGTPAGAGMGFTPPRFLKPGDVVECTIEGIGTLTNPVVE